MKKVSRASTLNACDVASPVTDSGERGRGEAVL